METGKNHIVTAFNIEIAKKILSGEVKGRFITDGENWEVRIICLDRNSMYPVVGLIGNSVLAAYTEDGESQDRLESVKHKLLIELDSLK